MSIYMVVCGFRTYKPHSSELYELVMDKLDVCVHDLGPDIAFSPVAI